MTAAHYVNSQIYCHNLKNLSKPPETSENLENLNIWKLMLMSLLRKPLEKCVYGNLWKPGNSETYIIYVMDKFNIL